MDKCSATALAIPPSGGCDSLRKLLARNCALLNRAQLGYKPAVNQPGLRLAVSIPDHDLIERIGHGSYGEVWLARNRTTGTRRAVKLVFRSEFEDERPYQREFEGLLKFEPISRSHPSQLAILHVGRDEGADCFYYVMELADPAEPGPNGVEQASSLPVQGASSPSEQNMKLEASPPAGKMPVPQYAPRTLRSELKSRGRLPVAEVIELGQALAEALGHLHSHGLVHRDIKPSNIIYVGGRPKLADIGLVTDASDQCSIVGTEGYLPPEGPGSPQADVFALGKVLYEAATGRDRRDYPALPEDLRDLPDAAPLIEFNAILLKACTADARERYANAEALLTDLRHLAGGRSVKQLRAWETCRRFVLKAAAATALGAATWWLLSRFNSSTPQPATPPAPATVFVLPFRNDGTNQVDELLRSRITDATMDGLALVEGIKVGPRKSGWARREEGEVRREAAERLGMRYMLSGQVGSPADALAVTLKLQDLGEHRELWTEMFVRPRGKRVDLEDAMIRGVAGRLGVRISEDAGRHIRRKLESNFGAHELFGRARTGIDRGIADFATAAIERLTRVLALDPNFVQAHAEMAFAYRLLSYYDDEPRRCMPGMEDHARKALAIDDTFQPAKYWLGGVKLIYYYDWTGALAEMSFSDLDRPSGRTGRAHTLRCLGRITEARAEHEIDSKMFPPWGSLPGETFEQFLIEGDYDQVVALCQDLARKEPNQPEWPLYLGRGLHRAGRLDEAKETLEALRSRWNPPVVLAELGMVYARLSRREEALETLRQMDEQSRSGRYVAPYFRAQVNVALGDTNQALDQLEKAYNDRCEHLVNADSWGLRTDPSWKDLQNHPRFQALLNKVGLDVWPR